MKMLRKLLLVSGSLLIVESVNGGARARLGVTLNDIINGERQFSKLLKEDKILEANALIQDGQFVKKSLQDSIKKSALEAEALDQAIKDNAGGFGYGDAISNTAAGAGLIGSALVGAGVSNLINQKAAERAAAGEAADEIVDGFLNYNDEEAALRKELMDQKEAKMRQVYGDTLDGLVDLADLAYQAQADYEASINDKNASIKEVRERREEANALLNELAAREAIVAERLTHNGLDTGFNTQAEKVQYLKDFMKVNRAEIQKRIGYLGRGKDMITDSRIGLRSAYNATADKFADAVDYSGLNRLGNSIVNSSLYNSLANGLSNVSESARNRWNGLKDWYANRRLVNVDLNVGQVK